DERGDLEVRARALVVGGDLAGEGVARPEQRGVERAEAVADHLRDRDRLAERTAETEDDRGDDAAAHVVDDDVADHLPASRAESDRGLLQVAGHAEEELA